MVEPLKKEELKIKTSLDFPKRPSPSKNFKPNKIRLVSNHFNITLSKKQEFIYLYSIVIQNIKNEEVMEDNRGLIQSIMRRCFKEIENLKEAFGENAWSSGRVLWATKNVKDPKSYEVTLLGSKYFVMIKKAKDISLKPENFIDNEQAASVRQYINIIIKRYLRKKKYVEWGQNSKYYDSDKKNIVNLLATESKIPLEVWTGFKTSCEVFKNFQLKILVDFSSRILRTDSVLDFMANCKGREHIEDELLYRSVVTNYGNYRMWRITGIDFEKNPSFTFRDDKNQEISLMEYYKTRYNIVIRDKKQPLLINEDYKKQKLTYLIPELVRMTGMTDEMRNNFKIMKEVAKHTRLEPTDRMNRIKTLTAPLAGNFSKEYGIEMEGKSIVEGVRLEMPSIQLGKKNFVPEKGNYQLRDAIFKPAVFAKNKWLIVYPKELEDNDYPGYFVQKLQAASAAYAIKVEQPQFIKVSEKHPSKVAEAIRKAAQPDTMIVVCIYPPIAKKGWYKALKDVCCKELGIPSQGVVSTTLDNEKGIMSVASKILLQMNVKVGLEPWIISKPAGLPEKTMIIGADVFHKVDRNLNSCVGFCASMDPNFGRYYSKVLFQKPGKELMTGIGDLVKSAVLKYFKFNNFFPEYIIFYRDGVGENQRAAVVEIEVSSILEGLKSIGKDYKPKFAEIVVTKRIDDRFFTEKEEGPGKVTYFNPPAGTLVCDGVVSNNFDFYLIAQNVTQGTCTPTHYFCVYNDTDLPQDMFYQLSYNQCYNYYNWNGSVRVPAACQYAHKLAYLVGQTLRQEHHAGLDGKLFYL